MFLLIQFLLTRTAIGFAVPFQHLGHEFELFLRWIARTRELEVAVKSSILRQPRKYGFDLHIISLT